ncbi:Hypothetical Protein Pcar [Strawberry lethal yellows phytoplasma (CPA) str. NZSb11]|uniref:DUF2779 domain-containing protein n=2 Tax=Phytoplasma australiense TaxID=59748 RepID=R4RPC1_PHYAS|nr:Hypothetical Protein Pcar [Strawberry lethal yellows phytoplasma (CPA) str. NZSb11]
MLKTKNVFEKQGYHMNISKTRFIKFLKVLKYVNYNYLYQNKKQFLNEFGHELRELMDEETYNKKISFLQTELDNESISNLDQKHLEAMNPYYRKLEIIAGRYLQKHFSGDVVYSLDTYKQKKFQMTEANQQFYCFLDGYQEDEKNIRIFETKATTSRKFLQLKFRHKPKESTFIFKKENSNMFLFNDLAQIYQEKIQKLIDPLDPIGKYIYDLTYQRLVIENSLNEKQKQKPRKYYLVVLNADYVLNNIEDVFMDPNLITLIDLTEITRQGQEKLQQDKNLLINHLAMKKNISQDHFLPQKIFTFLESIPNKNSIFNYFYNHLGFSGQKTKDLVEKKYYQALSLPFEWLHRFNNRIQYKTIETKLPYYQFEKINLGLQQLKYPLYYLDFESFPCPFPRFLGENPYSQSLFQFSLHIEKIPGLCHPEKDHISFLASNHQDNRKKMLIHLLNAIKDDGGSIIVYHKTFEISRLKELALFFPEYKTQINNLISRIFDLKDLLKGSKEFYQSLGLDKNQAQGINFYHEKMQGSFSIKKIAPLFSNLTYDNLMIQNGVEAFITYLQFPFMKPSEFQLKYQALEKYCMQDTWVMVEILKNLQAKNKNHNFPHLTFEDIN